MAIETPSAPAQPHRTPKPNSSGSHPSESHAPEASTPGHHASKRHTSDASAPGHHASGPHSSTPQGSNNRYIPALDGIRTLAVAAVVLYHLKPALLPGGMQGVTVFFVLSGFLITRLLLIEHKSNGRIDLKAFWVRRLRRLMPAILVVIVVTAALCTGFNHVMLTKMRPDIIPSALFFNNWWQIFNQQSYFNAVGDPSPLTHFWSLAIEMQFYLVWPIALMVALRHREPARRIRRAALALAVVSALEMAILYNPALDPSRVYYGTDTRVFSLLMGAWLAFIPYARIEELLRQTAKRVFHTGIPATLDVVGALGLAGLVALALFTNGYSTFPYRGGIALASALSLMLIAGCLSPNGMVARAFAFEPLVWLGKRSYGIYLWHYPLLLLMNPASDISDKPWWVYVVQVLIVIAVSEASYRFIETPCRHGAAERLLHSALHDRPALLSWAKRHIVILAISGATVLVALGGLIFVPVTSALSDEGAALLQSDGTDSSTQHAAGTGNGGGDGSAHGQDMPEGAYDITMIGDSVSLRAVDTFTQTFPHGHIDAAMNRQFAAGVDVYHALLDQDFAGRIAVFALGTNGPISPDDLNSLIDMAGESRIIVFVNNRAARPWCEPNNRLLADAASQHDNVKVIDWFAASTNRNELFDGDGIHLSDAGAAEYIGLIDDAVRAYLPLHPEDGNDERLMVAQRVLDSLKAGCALDLKGFELE